MRRLIHFAVLEEHAFRGDDPRQKADHQALLKRLTDRGESIQLARQDIKRWYSWSRTTNEYNENMATEIEERKAREKAEAKAKPK